MERGYEDCNGGIGRMRDIIATIGVSLVVLGGSALDSPDMLIPVSIIIIGGFIAASAGVGRG